LTRDEESAARRLLHLSDWTFVFGLPTTERGFENAETVGEFCLLNPPLLNFSEYQTKVLSFFSQLVAPFEGLGLRIIRYPTARQYARLLRGRSSVVLFTHCSPRTGLEFRDGMIPFRVIVDFVNPAFCGIADVTACEADGLLPILKNRAPNCAVKVSDQKLSYKGWLAYYTFFFRQFVPGPNTFAAAFLSAQAEIRGRA